MRKRSPVAFVVIILLLAVMGFAAFSSDPVETSATSNGVVLPPVASGRIAAAAVASQLRTAPVAQTQPPTTEATPLVAERSTTATSSTTSSTSSVPSTTAATTTTAAPTTTQPPATTTPPTTTTAPPTTTTAPPTTTTTAPDPTTTTTSPPAPPPAGVEQWRALVQTYWPAAIVDEALVVMACESNGDASAVNPSTGAAGLFQFIPGTWASASVSAGWSGADALDAEANIAVAYWLYSTTSPPWQQWSCKP